GHGVDAAAQDASAFEEVLVADSPALAHPVADRYARVIAEAVGDYGVDLVAAAATTFAKDILARAAGLLGGAMAGDVAGHEFTNGKLLLRRPMYAGEVLATVTLSGHPLIITVHPSGYPPAERR